MAGLSILAAAAALDSAPNLHASTLTFVDVTPATGISSSYMPSFALEQGVTIIGMLCGGAVVGDFNNDGRQDIFVIGGGQVPDRLYINQGNWLFVDRALEWGVRVKHMGMAACVGDFDNDGWLDIFVTSGGPDGAMPSAGKHRLYRNTGRQSFDEMAVAAGVNKASPLTCDGLGCAFGDYDLDGDLDLFVAGWLAQSKGNRLFRNNGDRTFTDVTTTAGIPLTGIRGFSPRFVDMDGDGFPEILLAADFGTSRYFRNNKDGTFTDITAASGTGLDANGMGHTVADLNGDGRLDWYVTSIFSLGNPETPGTGNMLYQAHGGAHQYIEVSSIAGVKDGNWGWGTAAVDLDNDGRLDLLETNGWPVYPEFNNKPSRVWLNQGNNAGGVPLFVESAAATGLWNTLQGRGLLNADFDLDGRQDVVIVANKAPMRIYRNLPAAGANWLRIALDRDGAAKVPARGVGANIIVTSPKEAPGWSILRRVDAGTNYQSQSELPVHVGVGALSQVDLRIEWPNRTATVLRDVAVNQHLVITAPEISDIDFDGRVDGTDLGRLLSAWGPVGQADDPCDLNADGAVDWSDVLALLWNWKP